MNEASQRHRFRHGRQAVGLALLIMVTVAAAYMTRRHSQSQAVIRIDTKITKAAISADGKFVGSVDKRDLTIGKQAVSVWDTQDGKLVSSTTPISVYQIVFSPNNEFIAVSGNDGVRLFTTNNGKLIHAFTGGQYFSAAFSFDGSLLAAGGTTGKVDVWRSRDFQSLDSLVVNKWVTSLAFSPDGSLLAVGTAVNTGLVRRNELSDQENPILVFELQHSGTSFELNGHSYGTISLAFNHSGSILASGGSDGKVRLLDLVGRRSLSLATVPFDTKSVFAQYLSFDSNDEMLAAALNNGVLLVLNGKDGTVKKSITAADGPVFAAAFNSNNLISVGADSKIRFWKLN